MRISEGPGAQRRDPPIRLSWLARAGSMSGGHGPVRPAHLPSVEFARRARADTVMGPSRRPAAVGPLVLAVLLAAAAPLGAVGYLWLDGQWSGAGHEAAEPVPDRRGAGTGSPLAMPETATAGRDRLQHAYLVRSTLMALQDANRSGNYAVLYALAAESFRRRHTLEDLAHAFEPLRRGNVDLAEAALRPPELAPLPHVDASGRLRLAGTVPSEGPPIAFDLAFDSEAGHWRLAAVSVGRREAGR